MLNSLILQTYSPIIVPFSFVYGVNFFENELIHGNFSSVGVFAIIIALLIYYDRVENKKKNYLLGGLIGLLLSYIMITYSKHFILSAFALFSSLSLIGHGVTDLDMYSHRNQYVYLSLFLIFITFTFLIPYEREYLRAYSISVITLTLAITILVFMTIDIPENV